MEKMEYRTKLKERLLLCKSDIRCNEIFLREFIRDIKKRVKNTGEIYFGGDDAIRFVDNLEVMIDVNRRANDRILESLDILEDFTNSIMEGGEERTNS